LHLPGQLLTQIYFSYTRRYQQDNVRRRCRLCDTEQIGKEEEEEKKKGARG